MMLNNIILTETEHVIKGENVCTFEETSVGAKNSMSVKAETIKIGGFGVPLLIFQRHFLWERSLKLVYHWKRRHIFNVVYPNDHAASDFENKLNAEENCQRDYLFWG